ncbi:MAG TPA: hypothetical protein PKG49_04330 [Nitrosomonas mobilis]|nr:hypothetical protein [Nitrosomonas mobilis]
MGYVWAWGGVIIYTLRVGTGCPPYGGFFGTDGRGVGVVLRALRVGTKTVPTLRGGDCVICRVGNDFLPTRSVL